MFSPGMYGFVENIAADKTKVAFPIFMTFFLIIIVANYSGLIPGIGTIGIWHTEIEHGEELKNLFHLTDHSQAT